MDKHPLRELWRQGKGALNGWAAIPDGFATEALARQGWDSVTVDMQHGVTHYDSAVECLRSIITTDAVPMVRVPWNEPGIIMKMIDSGAFGVICPMVNSRQDAEQFAGACRYPPLGYRSAGPIRSAMIAGADYMSKAEELVVTLAMIETEEGYKNLDEILETPGLDGVYIGPNDLSLGLGRPPTLDSRDEVILKAIDHILQRANAHDKIAGIHCASPEYAREMVDNGFKLVTVGSDARYIMSGAKAAVDTFRG